jgi:signal transduction histidine kinase
MLMPASQEFVALCQLQVALLTQGLGAAFGIIYLTEELADASDPKLVPIVAYPEAVAGWHEEQILSLLAQGSRTSPLTPPLELTPLEPAPLQPRSLASQPPSIGLLSHSQGNLIESELAGLSAESLNSEAVAEPDPLGTAEKALSQRQVVLPLVHEGVVMGLMVTARADRAWNDAEQGQLEKIAETLGLACVLDQRSQWMAQDLRQQRLLREQRRDLFDNLLHQFRNPMTAMRTFGKLLVKRIRPEDVNRTAAEGIVRESDRLQELLKQFDAAVDLDETDFPTESASPRDRTPPLLTASLLPAAPLRRTNLLLGASLQLQPHQITDVLNPLLDSAMAIAQERQLMLQSHIPSDLPPVQIDSRALREVLSNLIDNALKYTPIGGKIDVVVQRLDLNEPIGADQQSLSRHQAIAIIDTGSGIPATDLAHLFERGYRGVQAQTEIPGTGLGLAIAQDLIQKMQGSIQVFSPAQRSGFVEASKPFRSALPGTAVVVYLPEAVV